MEKETKVEAVKFIVVGGSVSALHLLFVYVLTSLLSVWYLYSVIVSYTCANVLNFLLQKFFVRKDMKTETIKMQFFTYTGVSLIHLGLNALLMYILVDFFIWPYLPTQALIVFLLAVATFFINRICIFR